jgi:hypothetical protein
MCADPMYRNLGVSVTPKLALLPTRFIARLKLSHAGTMGDLTPSFPRRGLHTGAGAFLDIRSENPQVESLLTHEMKSIVCFTDCTPFSMP